jgi:hypothetical protein
MIVKTRDCQDQTSSVNGLAVTNDEQLIQILDSLRSRKPFFAGLVRNNGCTLLIGIGEEVGCAQFSRSNGDPPYLMAVAPRQFAEHESVEFLAGNTPTPVPSRYILPFEKIKEIAELLEKLARVVLT